MKPAYAPCKHQTGFFRITPITITVMKKTLLLTFLAFVLGLSNAEAKKQTVKRVNNAEQLLRALDSNTHIVIPENTIIALTPAVEDRYLQKELTINELDSYDDNYEQYTKPRLGWSDHFDGKELIVAGMENLTIEGEGKGATIIVTPRYAYVLSFYACKDLKLKNLTMGHTEGGNCEGGVVELGGCNNVEIDRCDLYGCGTEGIGAQKTKDVKCTNTTIRDCTYQIMTLSHCQQMRFIDCDFHGNREYSLLNIAFCQDVSFSDCNIHDNVGNLFLVRGGRITLLRCNINHASTMQGTMDMVDLSDCQWTNPDEDHDCTCGDGEDESDYYDTDWDTTPLTVKSSVKKAGIVDFFHALAEKSRSLLIRQADENLSPANQKVDIIEVDEKNGYILIGNGKDKHVETDYRALECCYWRMANGHSLFAVNRLYDYSALSVEFYDYDPATHVLTPQPLIDLYENINVGEYARPALPRFGKSVQMVSWTDPDALIATQTFDGKSFVFKRTGGKSQYGSTPEHKNGVFDIISFIKAYYPDFFSE